MTIRLRSGWPGTVPAIAGGNGVLCAVSDGGGAMRTRPETTGATSGGGWLPGPTGGLGFTWAG